MLHLDSPKTVAEEDVHVIVRGWFAGEQMPARVDARVEGAGVAVRCAFEHRPDLKTVFPGKQTTGFAAILDLAGAVGAMDAAAAKQWQKLRVEILVNEGALERRTFEAVIGGPAGSLAGHAARALDARRKKLEWLKGHLMPERAQAGQWPVWALTEEQRAMFHVDPTGNISAHRYDETAMGIIAEHKNGMILDCGAGLRHRPEPNVVATEIVDYPSTDVVCVNEALPFADDSFDAAFTLNVLEHVTDPFRSAAEIMRVVKPGGTIYAVVPFLQPEHGYPHHFYNMTREGLRGVFEGSAARAALLGIKGSEAKVEKQWVSAAGDPIAALHWFAHRYAGNLPEAMKKKFLGITMGELISQPVEKWLAEPMVQALSESGRYELACTTSVIVRKVK